MNETFAIEKTETEIVGRKSAKEILLGIEARLRNVEGAWVGSKGNRDCPFAPLTHNFTDGYYFRELRIPAYHYIVGEIHLHEHMVHLMKGEIIVLTEEGGKHLKAKQTFLSPAGTKRIAFTLSDVIWINIHLNPTNEQNLEALEDLYIAKDYEDYEMKSLLNGNKLSNNKIN